MKNSEKLRLAAALITEVRDTLNLEHNPCQCCGLTVYANEREWHQRQMLNASLQRAEKVAAEMERS